MSYQQLAMVYDRLMEDTDYDQWAAYIHQLLVRYGGQGKRILDLGCGTGSISIPLIKMGWQVVGVDGSAEMLHQAREKSEQARVDFPLLHQDITQLEVPWPIDGAIATFDTLNYILETEQIQQLFLDLWQLMKDDGILIFDINTPFKLREYLGNEIYTYHSDAVDYIWENQFDSEEQICDMQLTFYIREGELYRKVEEQHSQRVYEIPLLRLWLNYAGFEVLGVFDQLEMEPLEEVEQQHKVVFVAKKTME